MFVEVKCFFFLSPFVLTLLRQMTFHTTSCHRVHGGNYERSHRRRVTSGLLYNDILCTHMYRGFRPHRYILLSVSLTMQIFELRCNNNTLFGLTILYHVSNKLSEYTLKTGSNITSFYIWYICNTVFEQGLLYPKIIHIYVNNSEIILFVSPQDMLLISRASKRF